MTRDEELDLIRDAFFEHGKNHNEARQYANIEVINPLIEAACQIAKARSQEVSENEPHRDDEWTDWIEHDGSSECPIPWAKGGEFELVGRRIYWGEAASVSINKAPWVQVTHYRYLKSAKPTEPETIRVKPEDELIVRYVVRGDDWTQMSLYDDAELAEKRASYIYGAYVQRIEFKVGERE